MNISLLTHKTTMAVSCLDYALHYTSRFPKTEKELRIQLLSKGYVSLDIDKTLTFLKEKDFINDEKFTEAYLRSECARKGKPMITVLKKLREKGIDKHIIQKVSAEIEDEIDEGIADRIKHEIDLLKKKDMEGFEIIQKLMKKGYKLGDIKRVVEKNQK